MTNETEKKYLEPLADRVLVRRKAAEEKTKGGIILTSSAIEKQAVGIVLSVGRGLVIDGKVYEPEVKVGDEVMFGTYAGTTIRLEDEELIVMKESDILCRLFTRPETGVA